MSASLPPVPPDMGPHIVAAANRHAIPVNLLAAICAKESSFNPWAWNPEPAYRYLWDVREGAPFRALTNTERNSEIPPEDFPRVDGDRDQEWWGQQSSWGVAQVMGAVAREHGFRGVFFPELCRPEIGLEFACRLLERLLSRYDEADAVSAYNAGRPTTDNYNKYVRPVMLWSSGYKVTGI